MRRSHERHPTQELTDTGITARTKHRPKRHKKVITFSRPETPPPTSPSKVKKHTIPSINVRIFYMLPWPQARSKKHNNTTKSHKKINHYLGSSAGSTLFFSNRVSSSGRRSSGAKAVAAPAPAPGAGCVGEGSACCCVCLAVFRADSISPPCGRPRLKALHDGGRVWQGGRAAKVGKKTNTEQCRHKEQLLCARVFFGPGATSSTISKREKKERETSKAPTPQTYTAAPLDAPQNCR